MIIHDLGSVRMTTRELNALRRDYRDICARGLRLDMSRGKPEPRQLDLSLPMLDARELDFTCEDGVDARNYGDPTGIPEAKRLFGELLGVRADQVIVGGNSSINLIYDVLVRALLHGAAARRPAVAGGGRGEISLPGSGVRLALSHAGHAGGGVRAGADDAGRAGYGRS